MKHTAYIAVGSNKGDRALIIEWAKVFLMIEPTIIVSRSSVIIETKPFGGPKQRDYLNAVWEIRTSLSPRALMTYILHIEKLLGRVRRVKNGPRTIDLDILFYDNKVIVEDGVVIPHRRLHKREFLLRLLCDISSDLYHPILGRSIKQLLREVRDEHNKIKKKSYDLLLRRREKRKPQ